jgi:hypothetical protein
LSIHVGFIWVTLWPPRAKYFGEISYMTPDDRNDEQPASLSLSQVYELIALEQIEMDRRVAERRGLSAGPMGDASNVIYLKARTTKPREIKRELFPRRRSAG